MDVVFDRSTLPVLVDCDVAVIGGSFGGGCAFQVVQSLGAIREGIPFLDKYPWVYGLVMAWLIPIWLLLLLALRDVTVAYIRIMCLHRGRNVAARASGKIKAIIQGGGAIVLAGMFAWPVLPHTSGTALRWAAVACVAAVTAWSAVDYFVAAVRSDAQ